VGAQRRALRRDLRRGRGGAGGGVRRRIGEGRPDRLGLVCDAGGANVAVASETAERVELCLFEGGRETERIPLPERTGFVHHGHVGGIAPGQRYGLRAHGAWAPAEARRFNPAKLLMDPCARAFDGRLRWHEAQRAHAPGRPGAPDRRDSAPWMPKAVALGLEPPVDPEERPRRPWTETVIYEAHVRALTRLHPEVPEAQRGTYEALGHPAVIAHLESLGVTAVELLPVALFMDEPRLTAMGLANHWGYNPAAFFAPEPRYFGPAGAAGLRGAVKALHAAGIETILDVVYNHTAELEEDGPCLSFRGLCDAGHYRHAPEAPPPGGTRAYANLSGCGNALDLSRPMVQRLVTDSLRWWAEVMGVDGFRFDLAPVLAREGEEGGFDVGAGFLDALRQDPTLAGLKLIAEPWDVGPEGYRLGGFPPEFAEWNDRFRDDVRGAWRGDPRGAQRLAGGLLGSAAVFDRDGRPATASVNYVASHDGFTLVDQTTYAERRNHANGEGNRDGHAHEISDPCGPDGLSEDPRVIAARGRRRRALLATVAAAQGTPMLLAGDEIGHTQGGNNNAYCQDDETTWLDWGAADAAMLRFARRAFALRARLPVLRQRRFLHAETRVDGTPEVEWHALSGGGAPDWADPALPGFLLTLRGAAGALGDPAPALIAVNLAAEPVTPELPPAGADFVWRAVLDSEPEDGTPPGEALSGGAVRIHEAVRR